MNRPPLTLFLFWAGLFFVALPAQTNVTYPPPSPPLVAPLAENAQWTLTIRNSEDVPVQPGSDQSGQPQAAKKKDLMEIRVTKADTLKRDILSNGGGSPIELWYADGMLLSPDSSHQISVADYKQMDASPGNGLGDPIHSAGYTGLDWLDLKYYDRVVVYQAHPCYHYSIKTNAPPPSSAEAWIDVSTGLPVAYNLGNGKLYSYRFLDPPGSSLILPPAYKTALDDYRKEQEKIKRLEAAAAALHRP
jgi:hypothetical protein